MERKLYNIDAVVEMINQGNKMVLSADETILEKLPKGNWIGGTIPYFMDVEEGIFTKDKIFVDDFSGLATDFKIKKYTKESIKNIAKDGFVNGFTVLVIPAGTDLHVEYGVNSLEYPNIFNNPITGFIAGLDLADLETSSAKVFLSDEKLADEGVALHIELPQNKVARVEITNIFSQDDSADELTFPADNFKQGTCFVNGIESNLVDYFNKINYDSKLPLTTTKGSSVINSCVQEVNQETKEVSFYAPMFEKTVYKVAKPIANYTEEFNSNTNKSDENVHYACNCILNYLYGELEGEKVPVASAITFGEIAYQLLNQTMVYLVIDEM